MIAVYKPSGIPSQPDPTGADDAMTLTSGILRELGERDELWLVHRLDRVVAGAMVFARTKRYAALLSELFATRGASKEYLAVVEGRAEGGVLTDLLFKDSAKGKAFVVKSERRGVKRAELEYTPLAVAECEGGCHTLVRIELHTGRFHQIRAQFSSRGMAVVGDGKYGSHDNRARGIALISHRIRFVVEGKDYDIVAYPELTAYPWSEFGISKEQL
ncbi:MAG: RNA pseudouridine synthase [Clostridia bacterium]|nr:RNA pseudouridine synthase [Clostridia bacterium]